MDLQNKKVIVTGGAKGIGKALVEKLLIEGAMVGVFDIDENALNEMKSKSPNVYPMLCDVSDNKQVEKCVDNFFNEFGNIDILINNAGITSDSPLISLFGGIKKHSIDKWNKIISVCLSSIFFMTLNVVEKMVKNRTKGLIINVSSISSQGNAGQTAYSAAKAGVDALTKTWAKELNPLNIRVAGISPGFTKTNIINNLSKNTVDNWEKAIPLKRMAEPVEIAEGIIFIIKNDYFNGKILNLDGGLIL